MNTVPSHNSAVVLLSTLYEGQRESESKSNCGKMLTACESKERILGALLYHICNFPTFFKFPSKWNRK